MLTELKKQKHIDLLKILCKIFLSGFIFIFSSNVGFSQTKTVNGVVTYYFNEYQGDKADIGSKVFSVDSATYHNSFKVIDSFLNASVYRDLYEIYEQSANSDKKMMDELKGKKKLISEYNEYSEKYNKEKAEADVYKKILIEYNCLSKQDFENLDKRCLQELFKIKQESNNNTTVNGSGNYSLSLNPGIYYIFIFSNNRKKMSISEIQGQFSVKKIDLNENNSVEYSKKFDL